MLQNAKWLFFDYGWTLINEDAAFEDRLRRIAEAANVDYNSVYETALNFYKQNQKGDRETAKLLGMSLPVWQKELETPYPNAAQVLELLSGKFKIGVIANQPLGTERRLETYGLLQYIDLVVASAEEGVSKPDRKIFEIALERSGCKASDAVMIGDRIDNDIAPANLLGMRTVWIKQSIWRFWKQTDKIEEPDCAVDSLSELCGIFFEYRNCGI